ncbi:MAG: nucleotidyltransferase domain-containing protein [Phenylobacterium sp.]|nr:nucleotidyltransferase domain-containing protein [Phenylobacterium sp.]
MTVPPLSSDVRADAVRRLDAIAREDGVRIVAAVESGSRAWGFPSPDSDYDVRFIYVRPIDDYLRLSPVRDVIERPIEGLWDVNGWDIRKALQLLCRGNAVVVEWLRSPLVYSEVGETAERMRALAARYGDADAAVRHYYGLLRGAWRREFEGREGVRLKKYFYVIRAAAALAWVRKHRAVPPMALPQLLDGGVVDGPLRGRIDELMVAKARTNELGEGPRLADLDAFITGELAWAEATGLIRRQAASREMLAAADTVFREAVLAG